MPRPEKSERREAKRQRRRKMAVDGRGLMTAAPNVEERLKRERRKRLAQR